MILVMLALKLINAGYDAKNIHLVWVLTDYKQAAKANKERDRVVFLIKYYFNLIRRL